MPRPRVTDRQAKRAVTSVAQVAAGAGLLMLWLNFVLAALLALIGLVLALIGTRRSTSHDRTRFRWVTTVCVIVLAAVAIRWYLSTPVEYVVDPTPQQGDPIPQPAD